MGQTYSVILDVKFKDKNGAAQALRGKIARADQDFADYGLEHFKELGIGTDTIEDLLKIFFGGWDGKLIDHGASMTSDFDASYGWETVMMDAFDDIAPFLEDGSAIRIYPDSGKDYATVYDGLATWSY